MDFDFLFIFTCILLFIFLLCCFYISKQLTSIKNKELEDLRDPLMEFSTDIQFQPFPQIIDVNSTYDCTPLNLRTCKIDDQTSCFGCKSLVASCHHLSQNTKYINTDGSTFIVPANSNENEGYCMTISSTQEKCNVYHGEFTLVQLTPDSLDAALICLCKNPGLIGNLELKGACDNVFVCEGKVLDINKPLEEIECDCPSSLKFEIVNNIPTCRTRTVLNANQNNLLNDIVRFPNNTLTTDIKNFDKTINQNINIDKLINPCMVCPITGKVMSNTSIFFDSELTRYCIITDTEDPIGIPIRRSQTERLLDGDYGPDAVLALWWDTILIYTQLAGSTQRLVYIISYNDTNKIFYELYNLDISKKIAIDIGPNTHVGLFCPIPKIKIIPQSTCKKLGTVSYTCRFSTASLTSDASAWIGNNNLFNYTIPYNKSREPPSYYLWGTENWTAMEKFSEWVTTKKYKISENKYLGYFTYNEAFYTEDLALTEKIAMICWSIDSNPFPYQYRAEIITSTDPNDFKIIRGLLQEAN